MCLTTKGLVPGSGKEPTNTVRVAGPGWACLPSNRNIVLRRGGSQRRLHVKFWLVRQPASILAEGRLSIRLLMAHCLQILLQRIPHRHGAGEMHPQRVYQPKSQSGDLAVPLSKLQRHNSRSNHRPPAQAHFAFGPSSVHRRANVASAIPFLVSGLCRRRRPHRKKIPCRLPRPCPLPYSRR